VKWLDAEDAEAPSVGKLVVDEVEGPALVRIGGGARTDRSPRWIAALFERRVIRVLPEGAAKSGVFPLRTGAEGAERRGGAEDPGQPGGRGVADPQAGCGLDQSECTRWRAWSNSAEDRERIAG